MRRSSTWAECLNIQEEGKVDINKAALQILFIAILKPRKCQVDLAAILRHNKATIPGRAIFGRIDQAVVHGIVVDTDDPVHV